MSTSNNNKIVLFVLLDLRRPVRIKVGGDPVKKSIAFRFTLVLQPIIAVYVQLLNSAALAAIPPLLMSREGHCLRSSGFPPSLILTGWQ